MEGTIRVLGKTRVSGPGQKASISDIARRSGRQTNLASVKSDTWMIRGSLAGRCLALKTLATANSFRARQASP